MRALVTAVALSAVVAAGCGPGGMSPEPGKLTLQFVPSPPSWPSLTVTAATMRIDHILVLGDAPPPMKPPPMQAINLDVLGAGASLTLPMLPPGVYSRVQLAFEDVMLQGTWRGTPFAARLAVFRPAPVDLRSPTGKQLGPAEDVTFTVGIDATSWFAGDALDGALAAGGQIVIDEQTNSTTAFDLTMRIARSFSLQ